MKNSEILMRSILGPIRSNIRPLVIAIDVTDTLLFQHRFSMEDILVTKHIYPDVAKRIGKTTEAATKSVERLSRLCWDALVEQELTTLYLGRALKQSPPPGRLLTYLAVYAHLKVPYFVVIEQNPHFLFQEPPMEQTIPLAPNEVIAEAMRRNIPLPVTKTMVFSSSAGNISYPVCPGCELTMEHEWHSRCNLCGQKLDWKIYTKAKKAFPGTQNMHI